MQLLWIFPWYSVQVSNDDIALIINIDYNYHDVHKNHLTRELNMCHDMAHFLLEHTSGSDQVLCGLQWN